MSRKNSGKPVVARAHACGGLKVVLGGTIKHASFSFAEARCERDRPMRASHKAHLSSQLVLKNPIFAF